LKDDTMPFSPGTLAHRFGHRLERRLDRLRLRAKRRLGWTSPAYIQPFRGFSSGKRVWAHGRVLEDKHARRESRLGGRIGNFRQMLRRFETDEIAGAQVRASFGGQGLTVVSNEEGYIDIAFDLDAGLPETLTWKEMQLDLVDNNSGDASASPPVQLPILLPAQSASFAVISDIDDTIVKTGATSLLRNLKTTFLNSVEQRLAFPDVAPFYQALQRQGSITRNPIFYVSSSPWNLYDFLEEFMVLNDIPLGPMMLRDYGWDENKFITSGHGDHKLSAIETFLAFYPDLPFILIGDSGQEDAAIYKTVVERHPGRIQAVYIRTLREAPERDEPVGDLLQKIEAMGVQTVLASDLLLAAKTAAERGWVDEEDVQTIRLAVR
jgi:phosphatidate phosphatase APP1